VRQGKVRYLGASNYVAFQAHAGAVGKRQALVRALRGDPAEVQPRDPRRIRARARFGAARADVALNYLDDKAGAESAAADIIALGRRATTIAADISKPEDARRLIADAERALGPIDVLVNNAGIFPRAPFLELTEEMWDAVLDTNLKSTFGCSQEAARRMAAARRPGAIINLSSGAPYRGWLRAAACMASKLGIVGLTRGMARELAPLGFRVHAVAPGVTNTAMPRLGNTDEGRAGLAKSNPSGRLAEPEDNADVVAFLASDDARHLVGQLIHVNGRDYHG
jgi:NAD(P)-dependent dehydrogenase (short-subunit alcohol dehydrogenase family)